MIAPRWAREQRTQRAGRVRALVASARSRVGRDFDVRKGDVGELCEGALILRLADAADERPRRHGQ